MRAVLIIAIIAIVAACGVERRTPGLACTTTSQCQGGRTCSEGFCVEQVTTCPTPCSACDFTTTPPTCTMDSPTGNITCPSGFSCAITCDGCGTVDCSQGASCTIDCTQQGACGTITCGPGACDVRCTATGACGNVSCQTACKCDVTCPTGDCGTLSCPPRQGGQPGLFCTTSGADDQPCTSSVQRCSHC